MLPLTIRPVEDTENDADTLYRLICAMADFEGERDHVQTTPERIRNTIGNRSAAEGYLAYRGNEPVGYLVVYPVYSTYLGIRSLYVEDLFVLPDCRGRGLGAELFGFAARLAVQRHCRRLDWTCLDWNGGARTFYEHMGALHQKDRCYYRLEGEVLERVAGRGTGTSETR